MVTIGFTAGKIRCPCFTTHVGTEAGVGRTCVQIWVLPCSSGVYMQTMQHNLGNLFTGQKKSPSVY